MNNLHEQIINCIGLLYPECASKITIADGQSFDVQFNQSNMIAVHYGLDIVQIYTSIVEKIKHLYFVADTKTIIVKTCVIIEILFHKEYVEKYITEKIKNFLTTEKLLDCIEQPKTVLIDFSSPNIAKQMHIGHLRSTIIGDTIAKLNEYIGNNVFRINHVGDWGTPFGMIIGFIKNNKIDLNSLTIETVTTIYKKAKLMYDSDKNFNIQSHNEVCNLQNGDNLNTEIWKKLCELSTAHFNNIYEILNIRLDVKGESYYNDYLKTLLLSDDIKNNILNDNGADIIYGNNISTPLILRKSDGAVGYDSTDLAALHYRIFKTSVDKIVYVTDIGQSLHFEILFDVANKLGWTTQCKLHHVGFGIVLGPDGKRMKTRSGDTVKLIDVINSAIEKATIVVKEKNRDWTSDQIASLAKKIAVNCIKYSDLLNGISSDYRYDEKKMFNTKGNSAVYLMYGLARCESILKNINVENIIIDSTVVIDNNITKNLILQLLKFDSIVQSAVNNYAPNLLCQYLYKIVTLFGKFYESCYVIQNGIVNNSRACIVWYTKHIIVHLFNLIGLEKIDMI